MSVEKEYINSCKDEKNLSCFLDLFQNKLVLVWDKRANIKAFYILFLNFHDISYFIYLISHVRAMVKVKLSLSFSQASSHEDVCGNGSTGETFFTFGSRWKVI